MTDLKLTRWQRLRLQRQLKDTPDARVYQRTLAILEASRGRSIAQIAQMLGVTRQSVYNWIEAYAQAHDPGALLDESRSGRPSLWTEDLRGLLQTLCAHAPDQPATSRGTGPFRCCKKKWSVARAPGCRRTPSTAN